MPKPVITIKPPYTPELLNDVQWAIEEKLENGGRVFEFGSGYSTIWFAAMAETIAVEDDDDWFLEVKRSLKEAGHGAEVILVPTPFMADAIDGRGSFDVVLVDCADEQRLEALKKAREHVRPGGWLVLDDTMWPALAEADRLMEGWNKKVIDGQHNRHWTAHGMLRYHQTTIYEKAGDA